MKIIENSVYEEYQAWKNQSPDTRWPKAKKTWAEHHNIHETTLTSWDKRDKVLNEDEVYNSEEHLQTQLKSVDQDLITACRKGSPQALKIFFQRTGLLVEKPQEIHIFNANDYITGSGDIYGKLRADYEKYGGACPVCGFFKGVDSCLALETSVDLNILEEKEVTK